MRQLPKIIGLAAVSLVAAVNVFAENTVFTPNDIKWTKGPDTLPKGAEIVILEGNPSEQGPFTIRLKFPANYRIPPHFHPNIEHITVLSGELNIGMGDKMDTNQATRLPTGSFAYMHPEMHHYAFTNQPAVIQLHSMGPWGITYVNAEDDPRNKK